MAREGSLPHPFQHPLLLLPPLPLPLLLLLLRPSSYPLTSEMKPDIQMGHLRHRVYLLQSESPVLIPAL